MSILKYPNKIAANEIDFVRDPRKSNTTRLFDDFLGGGQNTNGIAQFHALGSTSGGVWNNSASADTLEPTGFDSFGTLQAETSSGGTARSIMHLAQLMDSSPADGDQWLWEVRVKPVLATGNGFWSMSILRSDSGDSYLNIDGIPKSNNRPRCSIWCDYDVNKWRSHISDSESTANGTAADTAIDFADSTYYRIAALVTYESSGTKYDVKFYVDGVEAFNTELAEGSGSPFGKCFLYNNGTTSAMSATYDWSLIQFKRTETVDYLDINDI